MRIASAPLVVSVLTPVHDEELVLPELVRRIETTMEQWRRARPGADWEHLAVDDCSTDRSLSVLERLAATHPRLRPIAARSRGGQTGCFRLGFAHARGDIVVTLDADLQSAPEDIPRLLAPLEDDRWDVANAVRIGAGRPLSSRALSFIGNRVLARLVPLPVKDAGSNFTALRRVHVRFAPLVENDHRYLVPILLARGVVPSRVGDVPVHHRARVTGASKYRAFEKFATGLPEMIRFRERWVARFYGSDAATSSTAETTRSASASDIPG